MLKKLSKKFKEKGIVRIILLVIFGVAILLILGIDPEGFWNKFVLPILNFFWDIFLWIIGLLVNFFTGLFS